MSNTPNTEVLITFKDKNGLTAKLNQIDDVDANQNPENLLAIKRAVGLTIGRSIPIGSIRKVILTALQTYDHFQYYTFSTDGGNAPEWTHNQLVIGVDKESSDRLKLRPILSDDMVAHLERNGTKEEFVEFVRSYYPESYETWTLDGKPEHPFKFYQSSYLLELADRKVQVLGVYRKVENIAEFIEVFESLKVAFNAGGLKLDPLPDSIYLEITAPAECHETICNHIRAEILQAHPFAKFMQELPVRFCIKEHDGLKERKGTLMYDPKDPQQPPPPPYDWIRKWFR